MKHRSRRASLPRVHDAGSSSTPERFHAFTGHRSVQSYLPRRFGGETRVARLEGLAREIGAVFSFMNCWAATAGPRPLPLSARLSAPRAIPTTSHCDRFRSQRTESSRCGKRRSHRPFSSLGPTTHARLVLAIESIRLYHAIDEERAVVRSRYARVAPAWLTTPVHRVRRFADEVRTSACARTKRPRSLPRWPCSRAPRDILSATTTPASRESSCHKCRKSVPSSSKPSK